MSDPLPVAYVAGAVGTIFLLNVVPLLEECYRCWRGRAHTPA